MLSLLCCISRNHIPVESDPDYSLKMPPIPSPTIAIIGAGFAGLITDRCLKSMGIPSRIFEKRDLYSRQATSRSITLRPWAYEPLAKVLEIDYQQLAEKDQQPDSTMSESMYCSQGQIEDLLFRDLHVDGDGLSEIQRLESQMHGLTFGTVPLMGQTYIKSQLIIGADGVHSELRYLVLPKVKPRVLPYVVYYGSRRMTAWRYKNDFAPHMKYPATFQFRKRTQTLLRIIPCPPSSLPDDNGYVHVKYTYSRPAHENDPLFKPYREVCEANIIPNEFYYEIGRLTDLGPVFRDIFHVLNIRQDKILNWLMRRLLIPLEKLQELADRGILLIGDAAHTMPILGSEGANWAIKDGIDLANYLADSEFSQLRGFYDGRYSEWQQAVRESENRLFEMHNYDHDIFAEER